MNVDTDNTNIKILHSFDTFQYVIHILECFYYGNVYFNISH